MPEPVFRHRIVRALAGSTTAICLAAGGLVGWGMPSAAVVAAENPGEIGEVLAGRSSFTQRPRWEFGVGGGYFSGHDYPASDDPNSRAIALPFFIYRSPVLRIGGGGVRAVAIEEPKIRLDVSVGGSLNARSEDNGLREGLPDLDFLFELGPQLEVSLVDRPTAAGGRLELTFAGELRAVVATDFARNLYANGFVAEVGIDVARRRVFGSRVNLVAGLGIAFADERLQDYFYEVDPAFATPARDAYDGKAGYLGTEVSLGAAIRVTSDLRVFLGLQTGVYAGAANEDSPLFETTSSTGVAAGFAWTLARSRRTIDVIEVD